MNVSLKEEKNWKIMIYETACKLYLFRKLLFRRLIFKKFSLNRSKIKKIIVILLYIYSEISTWDCSWNNSRFSEKSQLFNSAESEKMLVAHTFEKNLRFECKSQIWVQISDLRKNSKVSLSLRLLLVWWHIILRKTQIFWEISDLSKSQRWWP